KYRSEWENDNDYKKWLKRSRKGIHHFYCKICSADYIGGLSAIKKHAASLKHTNNAKAIKIPVISAVMPFIKNINIKSIKIKEAELEIAAFIIEHNIAFNSAEHLVKLIKSITFEPEVLKNIQCNRTKCTSITKNVIGQTAFEEIIVKLKIHKFSLIVDESTDHSCVKNLALVARFAENFKINDTFVILLPIADGSAAALHSVIINFFEKFEIPFKKNMIGFGADGANTMMGEHHSLKTMLTNDVPGLFVLKCTCHSLALCASYACLKLPRGPEDFVRDVHSYMKYSFKRISEFREFQQFVDAKPHKLLLPAQNRWLSLISVIKRVLEQYNALKLYFQSQYLNDKIQASKNIYKKLQDPLNKLYLEFLEFILPIFTNMNMEFQAETSKIHLLYDNIFSAYKTILECYIKKEVLDSKDISKIQYTNPHNFVSIEDLYLGPKVNGQLQKSNLITSEEKHNMKLRCLDFYIENAHQIYLRFPFKAPHIQGLKYLNFLNPKNMDSIISIGPAAMYFENILLNVDLNELDREYRLLRNFNLDKNKEMLEFLTEVGNIKKGDDTPAFPLITQFAFDLLCLPHSSACVERIFSVINLNKTKVRNRLNNETLTGML
ncbi:Zinc finger protein KIAA0543, partial [Harpegnathos saltator]